MDKIEIWNNFSALLEDKITPVSYQTWFKNVELHHIDNNSAVLIVPLLAHKNQLINYYLDIIADIFQTITGNSLVINIILREELLESETVKKDIYIEETKNIVPQQEERYKYFSNFNKKYNFENFVVGDSNKFAFSSAKAVAERPGELYNPLFLYGKSGLGKTHLMHAIGNYLEEHSNKKVLYVTSEQFKDEFINLTKDGGSKDDNLSYKELFKNKYRDIDVLLIDDIQFFVGANKTQQEFTNTFNSLYYKEKQIIISSDRSVDDLKLFEERLKTRFNWGLKAIISVPDYDLKIKIIKNKILSSDLKVEMTDEIINFISSNCGNDVRNIEGSITRLQAFTAMMNIKNLTLDDVMEALDEYTNNSIYSPNTIGKIQSVVSDFYNLTIDDLKGKRRIKVIANARMIAMYLCRTMVDETYPKIGLEFGGRDHSTAIHAYEKTKKDIKSNKELEKIINDLIQKIREE